MPHTTKLWQERKRKGLCVNCGGKPKAGCLRCESCLKRQRDYDKVYRDKQKGVPTVEPQCKLPDGKMRADHVFDEDGLCACSARRTEFAPRPALVETPKPPLARAQPGKGAAHRPSPAHRAAFAGARSFAEPRAPERTRESPAPPLVMVGGIPCAEIIADLERQREQLAEMIRQRERLGEVIEALRRLMGLGA